MSPQQRLRRLGNLLIVAIVVLSISVLVLALFSIQTRSALCSFRGDLEARAAANQRILDENPGPVLHVFGLEIPRDVIENNLRGQRATLESLDSGWPPLTCQ